MINICIQNIPVDRFIMKNRQGLSFAYSVQCRNDIASSKCVSKKDVIPDVVMQSILWLMNSKYCRGWGLNYMYNYIHKKKNCQSAWQVNQYHYQQGQLVCQEVLLLSMPYCCSYGRHLRATYHANILKTILRCRNWHV